MLCRQLLNLQASLFPIAIKLLIQKFQLIKPLPKEEKSKEVKEVKELISPLIQIKNHNPEIRKIIEKDLPELLTKHASSLGPVVDEF
ncbi:hypothetical protein [Rickettsia honei]|uniref:hypothetical protein n=1 Tax=Rickettsia honei TaxID=37816 RepID=UPI000377D34C|nr:hypothetical protein [Rickettsia honei]